MISTLQPIPQYGPLLTRCFAILFFGLTVATLGFAKSPTANPLPPFIELAPDEQLAHPVVKGSLGPFPGAYVVLTQPKGEDYAPYRGRIVIPPDATKSASVHQLPRLSVDDGMNRFTVIVHAVMFRSVDRSSSKVLIVLRELYRDGSGENTRPTPSVYRWNGKEFVEDEEIRNQLFRARSAKEIDRRLAQIKAKGK
jgi:hypothetical protein